MEDFSLKGVSLLFVGMVLTINGLFLLGKLDRREKSFANLFVGLISFLVATKLIFSATSTALSIQGGALTYLFSFTYLWIAYNGFTGVSEEKGLGWYCLLVAFTAVPVTIDCFYQPYSLWNTILYVSWGAWALLWFSYFLNLVYGKINTRSLGWFTIAVGVFTAWVPGYLMLGNYSLS